MKFKIFAFLCYVTYTTLAQENVQSISLQDSLFFIGLKDSINIYWNQSPEKVYDFSKQMLLKAEEKSYAFWIAQANSNMGHALSDLGDESNLKKSIPHFELAIDLFGRMKETKSLANSYNGLSITYKELGYLSDAMKYSLKSVENLKKVKDTSREYYKHLGISYANLANRYNDLSFNEKELASHDSALFYFDKADFKIGFYGTYLNQSHSYLESKEYEKAIILARQAHDGFSKIKVKRGQILSLLSIVKLYTSIDEYDKAISYGKKGDHLTNNHEYIGENHKFNEFLVENLIQLNELDSASYYLEKIYKLTNSLGTLKARIQSAKLTAKLANKKGDSISALKNYRLISILEDSLEKRQNTKKAVSLIIENNKKQHTSELSKFQSLYTKNKKRFYLLLLVLVIFGCLAFYVIFSYRKKWLAVKRTQIRVKNKLDQYKEEKEYLNRKLVTANANLVIKNDLLQETSDLLKKLKEKNTLDVLDNNLSSTKSRIQNNLELHTTWDEFFTHFEKVHPNFIKNLKRDHKLTLNDIKLCTFIKMNLSNKEISQILNVRLSSVHKSTSRLKKKLKIDSHMNVYDFLHSL